MQYFCKNQERRLKVSQNTVINGIDYLEVVSPDQKTLEVHFLHPLTGEVNGLPEGAGIDPLEIQNIQIDGGVRIQNIKVDFISINANVLTINVNASGDFSTYTLRLAISATNPETPVGYDPRLSKINFSFKANCPSDFDCKPTEDCVEEKKIDPSINYLAKDYASFRKLALDRLSLLMPDWEERNAADLQIALVEIMAYTGDYLSYFQDAVATEAYLFKARKRISARRHARLLDYHVHNGCNARTWVFIEVEQGGVADTGVLKKGETLFTRWSNQQVMVNSSEKDKLLREPDVQVFETKHEIGLFSVHNEIEFYTWDDDACCLPVGATKATLYRSDGQSLAIEEGQVLIFEEILGPTTGNPYDASPVNRQAVRLTYVEQKVDILNGVEIVEIEWHEADALTRTFCISAKINGSLINNISVARGNIVLADHGLTINTDELSPKMASSDSDFRPNLPHRNVTISTPYIHNEFLRIPAATILPQNAENAIPEVFLFDGDETWTAQRDLLASNRFTKEFVAEIESDLSVQLRFGDDILGKKPGVGFQPRAIYRIGNGKSGNIGSDALTRIQWNSSGINKVRNPLPAFGGQNPETIEEVKQYAPEAFRTQERAVTEADYAIKTELHPQVQKALASFRWTGSWHTVFLTIDRKNSLSIDDQFKAEITDHLEKYRMAGYDLEIRPPQFVPLEIEMNVCILPGYFQSEIKQKLIKVFSRFNMPDGSKAFFHPDNFTFGQPVYLSKIYKHAMNIDGIESVELIVFKRYGRNSNLEIENGVLQPENNEIIRLDNDANFPENGKISFSMFGGL